MKMIYKYKGGQDFGRLIKLDYILKTRTGKLLKIIINESAKEDFKNMMEWDEMDWKHHTVIIEE